jgi:hypothetical protein
VQGVLGGPFFEEDFELRKRPFLRAETGLEHVVQGDLARLHHRHQLSFLLAETQEGLEDYLLSAFLFLKHTPYCHQAEGSCPHTQEKADTSPVNGF